MEVNDKFHIEIAYKIRGEDEHYRVLLAADFFDSVDFDPLDWKFDSTWKNLEIEDYLTDVDPSQLEFCKLLIVDEQSQVTSKYVHRYWSGGYWSTHSIDSGNGFQIQQNIVVLDDPETKRRHIVKTDVDEGHDIRIVTHSIGDPDFNNPSFFDID